MFFKISVLKNFANFTGNTCEMNKTFKNNFFQRTPPVAASVDIVHTWRHMQSE